MSRQLHTRFGKVVLRQSMLCFVGKNGALEDDLLRDTQPVKSVPHKVARMVEAPTTVDKSCCYIKY